MHFHATHTRSFRLAMNSCEKVGHSSNVLQVFEQTFEVVDHVTFTLRLRYVIVKVIRDKFCLWKKV